MDAAAGQAWTFQQAQADWQQLLLAMKQRRHAAQVSLLRLPSLRWIVSTGLGWQ